jgi:uncharacterized membrane protein/uncharacterized protein YegL
VNFTGLGLPLLLTDPWWLAAFALLPPLVVLALWEGRSVRRRRTALGVASGGADRWRSRLSALTRALIVSAVLLALAGLQVVRSAGPVTTVYLVDVSESVGDAGRAAAHAYVQAALNAMRPDDRAAVAVFGAEAQVVRPLGAAGPLPDFKPLTGPPGSDIGAAVRLGLALLPAEGERRLVLLSDGQDTGAEALALARQASAAGAPISVVPLQGGGAHEVAVESVAAPSTVPAGQSAEVTARVTTNVAEGVKLSLFEDDALLTEREAQLQPGGNVVTFTVTLRTEGFHSYRVRVDAADDRWAQNNEAAAAIIVQSPPRVLIVAGSPDDGEPLRAALVAAHMEASVVSAKTMPHTLVDLTAYDTVVLANTPASAIGPATLTALQAFTRDLGRGLVMIGGEGSFGAGGYVGTALEPALPVSLDVRSTQRQADVALALLVDKSGSMGRCHCGATGAFRSSSMVETGVAKVDIAKQAILQAAATLAPTDRISVITFDSLARPLVQMQPMGQLPNLAGLINGIQADGTTNLYAGLRAAADTLEATDARLKHIILLSDGWSDQTSYDALMGELRDKRITLSTIAAGSGSSDLLSGLARQGGGRYYAADDASDVPQLFLKETVLATGSYLIEGATQPALARAGPILKNIDTSRLPALQGYNSTTPRATADLLLAAPNGDPLLAGWQYGLGRTVAWTSDLKGRWAPDWVTWSQFPQFAAQMVSWTLPRGSPTGLESAVSLNGGRASIVVDARDANGAPQNGLPTNVRVRGPDGAITEVDLTQTAPGRYEGSWLADTPGAYAVEAHQLTVEGRPVSTDTTSLVAPYPAEYRVDGQAAGATLLREVAQASGGAALDAAAPATGGPSGAALPTRVALWPLLLTLALLLFPFDVALRRVTMGRGDLRRLLRRDAP